MKFALVETNRTAPAATGVEVIPTTGEQLRIASRADAALGPAGAEPATRAAMIHLPGQCERGCCICRPTYPTSNPIEKCWAQLNNIYVGQSTFRVGP